MSFSEDLGLPDSEGTVETLQTRVGRKAGRVIATKVKRQSVAHISDSLFAISDPVNTNTSNCTYYRHIISPCFKKCCGFISDRGFKERE